MSESTISSIYSFKSPISFLSFYFPHVFHFLNHVAEFSQLYWFSSIFSLRPELNSSTKLFLLWSYRSFLTVNIWNIHLAFNPFKCWELVAEELQSSCSLCFSWDSHIYWFSISSTFIGDLFIDHPVLWTQSRKTETRKTLLKWQQIWQGIKINAKIIKQKVKSLGLAHFCLFFIYIFYNKDSKIKKSWKLIIQTIKNKRGQAKIRREEEKVGREG